MPRDHVLHYRGFFAVTTSVQLPLYCLSGATGAQKAKNPAIPLPSSGGTFGEKILWFAARTEKTARAPARETRLKNGPNITVAGGSVRAKQQPAAGVGPVGYRG